VVPSVRAQGRSAELDPLLKAFFEAADPPARQAAIAAIRAVAPNPLDVEKGLRRGRNYPADARKGWQALTHTGSDGKARPYFVYVPGAYSPARRHPLVVTLHGNVNERSLPPVAVVPHMNAGLQQEADKNGWLLIAPLGQLGASWYDRVGIGNILAQLAAVKRRYNVDEDRVFLIGYSAGGHGAYVMGYYHPTPWAGFVAVAGNVAAPTFAPNDARLALGDAFPANLSNRPIHAANGGLDRTAPSAVQKLLIDQLRDHGARIAWTLYSDSGHEESYVDKEVPKMMEFFSRTARDPAPKHVVWETSTPEVGRCDWVRIDEVRDVGNNAGPEPSNLILVGPPRLGIMIDRSYSGPGLRVQGVPAGSLVQTAGLQSGDVLTRLDGVEIKTGIDAENVTLSKIQGLKKGEIIRGELRRGKAIQSFSVEVPEQPREPLFKRTGPAGRLEVKASGNRVDVTARGVARYTLFVRRGFFDLDQPIHVVTNGAETFRARVEPDLAFMLEQTAKDDDRSMVYCAKIEVEVPVGAARERR
jgi:poly(3-hydroxybutyrate) depolymerase